MNSFKFVDGSSELLNYCDHLWELFISNQAQNAGEMSSGVEEYLCHLRSPGLEQKTRDGQLYVQLVYLDNQEEPIGFCITSLTKDQNRDTIRCRSLSRE